ncbi:MAG TPA: methylmalonyl-CoA mutase family protein, partial [Candidatus Angelobacter sp.]
LGLPTEEAARIALRTQQIVGYETGAANTIDPLAGSYYIESLTSEIEQRATLYLAKIEALGGTLRAIEQGYIQQEIQNAAYDFQQGVDRQENVVVGVNRFQTEGEKSVPVLRIDEALEGRQVERLRALRLRRDKAKWESAIRNIEDAARGDQNLMPHIIHAVENYCTVGEVSDALRRVFGEHQETVVI